MPCSSDVGLQHRTNAAPPQKFPITQDFSRTKLYPILTISNLYVITAGPDGALWFTNQDANSVGRITTSGVVTSYTVPGASKPRAITAGPDGALWFTNLNDSIGRIITLRSPPTTTTTTMVASTTTADHADALDNGHKYDRRDHADESHEEHAYHHGVSAYSAEDRIRYGHLGTHRLDDACAWSRIHTHPAPTCEPLVQALR